MATTISKFVKGNAIAVLALFVALGGSSYAAIGLAQNSVGAKQIKKGAVRTAEVKNRSLKLKDLSPAARDALKGQQGAPGTPGTPGISGLVRVDSMDTGSGPHSVVLPCPDGKRAIGGGYSTGGVGDGETLSVTTDTVLADGISYRVDARGPAGDWNLVALAYCAYVG